MSISPWSSIPAGRDAIPVSDDSATPHRFMWALQNKKNYTLLYQINEETDDHKEPEYPTLKSIDIYRTSTSPPYLAITLLDSSHADIFLDFCNDLIKATQSYLNRDDGCRAIVNRCWRWHSLLFKRSSPLLSEPQQQGLFAELSFLLHILVPSLGPAAALELWKGPYGAYHDFVSSCVDIEVKSVRGDALPRMKISSEHQLENPDNKALYLVCFSISKDLNSGLSLTSLAEQLSSLISDSSPSAMGLYQFLLDEAGFSWSHNYENSRWSILSTSCFHVSKNFPTLTRSTLHPAITRAEYDLNPLLLSDYSVTLDSLVLEIK